MNRYSKLGTIQPCGFEIKMLAIPYIASATSVSRGRIGGGQYFDVKPTWMDSACPRASIQTEKSYLD